MKNPVFLKTDKSLRGIMGSFESLFFVKIISIDTLCRRWKSEILFFLYGIALFEVHDAVVCYIRGVRIKVFAMNY